MQTSKVRGRNRCGEKFDSQWWTSFGFMLGDDKLEPHPSPPMLESEFSTILVSGNFLDFFMFCNLLNLILNKYFYGWLIFIFFERFHVVERFVGNLSKLKAYVFRFITTNNTSRRNPNYWQHYKEPEYWHGIVFFIKFWQLKLYMKHWNLCV